MVPNDPPAQSRNSSYAAGRGPPRALALPTLSISSRVSPRMSSGFTAPLRWASSMISGILTAFFRWFIDVAQGSPDPLTRNPLAGSAGGDRQQNGLPRRHRGRVAAGEGADGGG